MLNARVALDKTFLTTLSSLISCSMPIRRTAVQAQPHIARTTVAPSRAGCAVLPPGKQTASSRTRQGRCDGGRWVCCHHPREEGITLVSTTKGERTSLRESARRNPRHRAHCSGLTGGDGDRKHQGQDDQRRNRRERADAGHREIDALALYKEEWDQSEVHDPRRGQAAADHDP